MSKIRWLELLGVALAFHRPDPISDLMMAQFDWTMGKGDKPQAVLQRMEKVLTAQT